MIYTGKRCCKDCKHNVGYYNPVCRQCSFLNNFEPKNEEKKIWITTAGGRPGLKQEFYRQMLNSVYGIAAFEAKPDDKVMQYIYEDVRNTKELYERMRESNKFKIEKVIFNGPCTIVIWADKTKTIVKCQEGETFDPEKGLAMAIAKKALGNKGSYFNEIKRWTSGYNDMVLHDLATGLKKTKAALDKLSKALKQKEAT